MPTCGRVCESRPTEGCDAVPDWWVKERDMQKKIGSQKLDLKKNAGAHAMTRYASTYPWHVLFPCFLFYTVRYGYIHWPLSSHCPISELLNFATNKLAFTFPIIVAVTLRISTRWILAAFGPSSAVGIQSTLFFVSYAFLIRAIRIIVAYRGATICCFTVHAIQVSASKWALTFFIILTVTFSYSA